MADFDTKCFKCVEEMGSNGNAGGAAANILRMKMQQGLVEQDLDNIYLCNKHK